MYSPKYGPSVLQEHRQLIAILLLDISSGGEEIIEVAPLAKTMERASYRFLPLSLSFILAIVSLIGE